MNDSRASACVPQGLWHFHAGRQHAFEIGIVPGREKIGLKLGHELLQKNHFWVHINGVENVSEGGLGPGLGRGGLLVLLNKKPFRGLKNNLVVERTSPGHATGGCDNGERNEVKKKKKKFLS